MMRTWIGSMIVVSGLLLFVAPAEAQQEDRQVARMHFERGVSLYEAGTYERALEEFRAAYEAQPHPAVLVNIANCYSRTERPVRAIHTFQRYLREQGSQLTADERGEIERVIEEQRRLVGSLTIRVQPEGATVLVDGVPVGSSPLEHTELVRAGQHTVEVRAEGRPPLIRQGTIRGGQTATMTVSSLPSVSEEPSTETAIEVSQEEPTEEPEGAGFTPPPAEPPQRAASRLSIMGSPGADIEIDRRRVGRIPWEGELEAGTHEVFLSGSGLLSWDSEMDFASGELTEIDIDLTRGERPRWIVAMEWILPVVGLAFITPGIAQLGSGWARYNDSEGMFGQIEEGLFSSRHEREIMWDRYDEMFAEYEETWQRGWALMGVGIGVVTVWAVLLILDRAAGLFSRNPSPEIEISPFDEATQGDSTIDGEEDYY